jgi:SHS2 domain-containing protein
MAGRLGPVTHPLPSGERVSLVFNAGAFVGRASGSYEIIDHTADVGIRVEAPTAAALFETAARALTELVTDVEAVMPRVERAAELQEESLDVLLVSWLQELLYLLDTEGLAFSRFQVTIDGTRLHAALWGEPFNPELHPSKTDIKAVTYHQLEVVKRGESWEARVIFDV